MALTMTVVHAIFWFSSILVTMGAFNSGSDEDSDIFNDDDEYSESNDEDDNRHEATVTQLPSSSRTGLGPIAGALQ